MPLTGDFRELERWQSVISDLGSPSSIADVSKAFANETLRLTDQAFEQERSPLGPAWARKKRSDGRKVGQGKTGRLRETFNVKQSSRFGFTVGSDAIYKRWFHGGKKGQRPRPISPGTRIPRRWDAAYDRVWNAHCLLKLRGR